MWHNYSLYTSQQYAVGIQCNSASFRQIIFPERSFYYVVCHSFMLRRRRAPRLSCSPVRGPSDRRPIARPRRADPGSRRPRSRRGPRSRCGPVPRSPFPNPDRSWIDGPIADRIADRISNLEYMETTDCDSPRSPVRTVRGCPLYKAITRLGPKDWTHVIDMRSSDEQNRRATPPLHDSTHTRIGLSSRRRAVSALTMICSTTAPR